MKTKKHKKSTFDSISNLKELMGGIKAISILSMIVHTFVILLIIFFSVYSITRLNQVGIEKTIAQEEVVEFISSINNYDMTSVRDYLLEYKNATGMILIEILFPSIINIIAFVLYNIVCLKLIKFSKDVKDNKMLFTKEKLNLLKQVRNILIFAFVCMAFTSNFSIFVLMIFVLLMEMILYFFNYCVNGNKDEEKEV